MAVTADLQITAGTSARPSPRAVVLDATGSRSTTENTRAKAFHHLLYKMTASGGVSGNWGDGTYGSAGARSGLPRDTHWGPIGSFVFEVADDAGDQTYTVDLYVTDGVTADTDSVSITVYDPNGANGYDSTLCVETAATGTGGPAGATYLTSSDYDSAINTTANGGATHDRILFKRTQTFTASTTAVFDVDGPIHVGSWGSGTIPLIETGFNGALHLVGDGGIATISDLSFADLQFDGNSGAASIGFECYSTPLNFLLLRSYLHHYNGAFHFSVSFLDFYGHAVPNGVLVHDTSLTNSVGGAGGNLIFCAAKNFSLCGCDLSNSTSGEHVIRQSYTNTGNLSYNSFANAAAAKHVIKFQRATGSACIEADGNITQFAYWHSNKYTGSETTDSSWVVTWGPADTEDDDVVQNCIMDGDWHAPASNTDFCMKLWARDCTIRNSLFNMNGNSVVGSNYQWGIHCEVRGTEGTHNNNEIYNNTFYSDDSWGIRAITIDTGSGHIVRNNLVYNPNKTGTSWVCDTQGGGSFTESNNSTDAQITTNPNFASGSPVNPADFEITTSSYAKAAGSESAQVVSDFFETARDVTNLDIGFHAFTTGTLPDQGGGGESVPPQRVQSMVGF